MSPEEHAMLEQAVRMTEENNRLLRRLHGSMIWSRVFQVIYWLFIIAVAFGAYYFIRPYLGPVGQIIDKASQITNIPNLPKF